jgi:hypothetical protein
MKAMPYLEADLGDPIEEGRQPVSVRTKTSPAHPERRRSRLRSLQTCQPGQYIEEIADQDDDDCLGERQPEDDYRERAVDDEFDVPDRARPHPEQPAGSPPAI